MNRISGFILLVWVCGVFTAAAFWGGVAYVVFHPEVIHQWLHAAGIVN
jgi:hypothetical protein